MSKIAEFKELKECLKKLSDSLDALIKVLEKEPEKEEKVKDNKVSLEELRAVLAEKSRDGHTEKVRELLIKYGADRLSDIDKESYEDLLKEARAF